MTRVLSNSAAGAALSFALALLMFSTAPSATATAQNAPACSAPAGIDALEHAPVHVRERITQGLPIKIVAIGSSSTFGAGASSRANSYPGRLEAELKQR